MSDDDVGPLFADDDTDSKSVDESTSTRRTRTASSSTSSDDTGDLADLAAVNAKLAEKKIKLEEMRFKLDERKADHAMMIELREFDLRQAIIERERQLLLGDTEHWMKSYWRSAAGWVYLVICFMDFVGFPLLIILMTLVARSMGVEVDYDPWSSITLTEGGLIHLSFGAILGVTAWTRGKEKLAMRQNVSE